MRWASEIYGGSVEEKKYNKKNNQWCFRQFNSNVSAAASVSAVFEGDTARYFCCRCSGNAEHPSQPLTLPSIYNSAIFNHDPLTAPHDQVLILLIYCVRHRNVLYSQGLNIRVCTSIAIFWPISTWPTCS